MLISRQERRYLKNKHKVGKNNSKGNIYENLYTTYCIALFINSHINQLDVVHLTTQLEGCFVDDLLIEEQNTAHRIYHQIKDVKDLSWKTKRLQSDFERQMDISSEAGENFELKLVHSNSPSMVTPIPEKIVPCTSTDFFPAEKSINQLILSYSPFKKAIQNISASGKAEDDELLGIAEAILGIWMGREQKNVSLHEISDELKKIGQGYINIKTYPNINISNNCQEMFRRFGLNFYTCGIDLYWSTDSGNLSGKIEWTPQIEQKFEKEQPSDFWELIELLS